MLVVSLYTFFMVFILFFKEKKALRDEEFKFLYKTLHQTYPSYNTNTFLDLHLCINEGQIPTSLHDKRNL